jgi:hypothetical protein
MYEFGFPTTTPVHNDLVGTRCPELQLRCTTLVVVEVAEHSINSSIHFLVHFEELLDVVNEIAEDIQHPSGVGECEAEREDICRGHDHRLN